MLTTIARRLTKSRALFTMALLAASMSATACNDSTSPEEDEEPAVTSMVLTFSNGQTVTVTGAGSTPSVRIPVGATTVTGQFLRANGSPDPLVIPSVFRLVVRPPAGNIAFAQNSSNAFSGTLSASTATTTAVPVTFALLHVVETHEDFGPFTVNVTVGN